MRLPLALLLILVLTGCGSSPVSSTQARHALLVDERVQVANLGDPTTVEAVDIRDVVVHEWVRHDNGVLEARVTYTAVRPEGSIRRDRRIFIHDAGNTSVLAGQCSPRRPASCDQARRRLGG